MHQFLAGAASITEQNIQIVGLAARLVKYTLPAGNAAGTKFFVTAPTHLIGLIVPEIQQTAMGFLKLTVIASSAEAARLNQVDAMFGNIRFKRRREDSSES